MAQRELQVTALRPAASAMETYVRPEFERNAAAISRLTQSISATNDARSQQQAQIDGVRESMAGGVTDPNDRTGWSTDPVYVAARLEARGVQYGDQLLTQIQDNYNSEFKLGSSDDGRDLDAWLNEQFAPASEALGNNPFLLSGANSVLAGVQEKIRTTHLSYLDERAKKETATNMAFQVDRLIHGKVQKTLPDGTQADMDIFDKIEGLNNYALELAATTHYTKGEANEAIFNSVVSQAESFDDAERGLAYLELAEQLMYAKAGDGAVNAKAAHTLELAESRLETKLARDASDAATARKTKTAAAAREMTDVLVTGLIEANENGEVFSLTAEDYSRFNNEAGMPADDVNKLVNSMKASFAVEEHKNQRDNWHQISTSFHALRGSPQGLKDAYADMYKKVADGHLHHSRLKEAQTLLKELETAAPVIKHKLLEDAMRTYIDSAVERVDEWDSKANAEEKKYKDQWYALLTPLINDHYYIDPKDPDAKSQGFPSANQLQGWVQTVESQMNALYADEVKYVAAGKEAVATWNTDVMAALSNSATAEGDGYLNIAWITPVGTANIRSVTGSLDADDINDHFEERPFVKLLVNIMKVDPTYEFEWGNPEFGKVGSATAAQHFDRVYGAGAASDYWNETYGPTFRMTSRDYSNKDRTIRALQAEYLASKKK